MKQADTQFEHIDRPILRDVDSYVEGVYPLPGTTETPDFDSQQVMGRYVLDRFVGENCEPKTRLILRPSGRTVPGLSRDVVGSKEVTRFRRTQEWLIRPRTALAITLGSLVLFNTLGNLSTVEGAAKSVGHEISNAFSGENNGTPGSIEHVVLNAQAGDSVESTFVDPKITKSFVDQVQKQLKNGATLRSIHVTGNTSDEWVGATTSIGVNNAQNYYLGFARANQAVAQLNQDGLKVKPGQLVVSQEEHVISPSTEAKLQQEVQAAGYSDITQAVTAENNSQIKNKSLAQKIKDTFTSLKNRGVRLDATLTSNKVAIPSAPDKDPIIPKPGFRWFIPMIPIRRREMYDKTVPVKKFSFNRSQQLMRPELLVEDQDQAWLRIRPEAIAPDQTLIDDAWAYTRKYEHLMREGRIADLLRVDFEDDKGEAKSIRIMFIDSAPSQETIDNFSNLLERFANMQGGKIGDNVKAIFVYPSENAGTEHGDPKKIALGIDDQSDQNCLGTYTYPLKLVELHMPTNLNPDELSGLLDSFNGPSWVLSHEVSGHGTDRDDTPQVLVPVRARGIANAHLIRGDVRTRRMEPIHDRLKDLPRPWSRFMGLFRGNADPIEYDITYTVQDNNGNTVTINEPVRVNETSPLLRHAKSSTIVGHKNTQYAATDVGENYAEVAASVTTGITVPYRETNSTIVQQMKTDDGQLASFAEGYRPDQDAQDLFTENIDAIRGSFPVDFKQPKNVSISHINPANDPVIRREMLRVTKLVSPRPQDLIAILARVARRNK